MTVHAETYHDLYENAPCGYLTLSKDFRILAANKTFSTWIGRQSCDVIGRRFLDLLTTAGKILFETRLAYLLHLQAGSSEVALDFLRADSNALPSLVNAAQSGSSRDAGQVTHLTIFNATERRRYESELRAAKNELSKANAHLRETISALDLANKDLAAALSERDALYGALPVGIFSADSEGTIRYASQRFRELLAVAEPTDWLSGVDIHERNEVASRWAQALSSPEAKTIQFTSSAAESQTVEVKTVSMTAPNDGETRIVGFAEDVTIRVRAEADRRQSERDAAVRTLTSGLAHHLNNLLSVTMGNLEFLDESAALSEIQRSVLGDGMIGLERAASVVKRLLVYSGQGFVKSAGFRVDSALRLSGEKATSRIRSCHSLAYDLRCGEFELCIDQEMLESAVSELIANAADAMPDGGVIICSCWNETLSGSGLRSIVIEVSDYGNGMDSVTAGRAREPFFTTHRFEQRLGLGLSLVDGIARLFGGSFYLNSQEGQGTTARLSFPVHASK